MPAEFDLPSRELQENEIPLIVVRARTLPEAWEKSVLMTLEHGASIPTEYDQEVDPESKDVTMVIEVAQPFAEPRIHKAIPCGFDFLEEYRAEVVEGTRKRFVRVGGWSYSYHGRLTDWPEGLVEFDHPHVNQLDNLVKKLAQAPHSRRAQATTWYPPFDSLHDEPPCLQRVWCRVVQSGNLHLLEMNTHWRSRDAFKAAFMNMFAMTELQARLAEEISQATGRTIEAGRYTEMTDSYHIYGNYLRKGELERFQWQVENLPFERRVISSESPTIEKAFERGRQKWKKELRENL